MQKTQQNEANDEAGYKVSVVEFDDGAPRAPSSSKTAAIDIFQNSDLKTCYANNVCIRPVSLAWDSKGRLFFSSDATGEIWMILRADGKPTSSTEGNPGPLKPNKNTASLAGVTSWSILALVTTIFAFVL